MKESHCFVHFLNVDFPPSNRLHVSNPLSIPLKVSKLYFETAREAKLDPALTKQ